jgi:PIN domain nuclease of toxin-antitoxin system
LNLLLDTHVLLWFLNDDPQLPSLIKAMIVDPTNEKFVSVATCWEIAIKVGRQKLSLGEPATTFLPRELSRNRFHLLDIKLTKTSEEAPGLSRGEESRGNGLDGKAVVS